ncbi:LPS assembly lipoprotein LptE [Burkholderia pseudomultivorans]|uniref:LPS-assembly lipoprotein LptE n=1 Tax=Burkholderia pseudomultivorans TaxID=1207504 RepID=A0A132F6S4_9BURK|nr:LPS assembly lipoprotein LptE [Burkholderia pseudomultivorans]EGD05675.1 putative lipoprotein [Burkholderia sp. TJI49]AOI93874.1 lipopolysaccharide-assembly family protein [Burkholderia pseudomultivorans]KVC27318.1 lipopolysaccharide-assembly family protein [Burkholderia pseudomultivorans]KVC41976.1 lipopolysaccharide-assembly family protein [Burkholderia pseudomultivorans]KVC44670.1 lipopolysaccharide-assembly family protein [Burkholderia pseudomultivorans]
MIRRSFLMLVGSAVALSACGFQLRGQQDYAFKRLLIAGAPAAVSARLTRLVEAGSDTKIVKSPDDADAVLRMWESRGQNTLTLNQYGSAQEYALFYTLNYTLTSKDGTVLIPPSAIALNRAMTYSDQYTNAKAQEADILYGDMQNDAVDQLMRRLAIVHSLTPAPEDVVPGVAPRAPLPPPPL